jgi:hypothetical protein
VPYEYTTLPSAYRLMITATSFFPRVSKLFFPSFRATSLAFSHSNSQTRVPAAPQYFRRKQTIFRMASTSSTEDLTGKLSALGLNDSLPKYPNCHPDVNIVDIYRAHLTSILAEVTGVDAAIIYPALAWTQTLEKGDLVLPVPALRVKGKKPVELAAEWAEKVRHPRNCSFCYLLIRLTPLVP